MGNILGGGRRRRRVKVMKINGETMKLKIPVQASEVVKDYPGHVLLDSDAVKYFGVRAKPLEPQQKLQPRKIYFLVELPKIPIPEENIVPRRVRSTVNLGAKDRLELLMLSKRSVSDITTVRGTAGLGGADGPAESMRVKVRLPRAQVEKLVEESRDEAEVTERIVGLYMEKAGELGGGDGYRRGEWKPMLGSVGEVAKASKKHVSFVPEEREEIELDMNS